MIEGTQALLGPPIRGQYVSGRHPNAWAVSSEAKICTKPRDRFRMIWMIEIIEFNRVPLSPMQHSTLIAWTCPIWFEDRGNRRFGGCSSPQTLCLETSKTLSPTALQWSVIRGLRNLPKWKNWPTCLAALTQFPYTCSRTKTFRD